MTGTLDINSLASWATVVVALAAAAGGHRKLSRWLDSIDIRFQRQDERFEQQANDLGDVRRALNENHKDVRERLAAFDAQLKPNGGGSHHDLMAAAAARAAREAVRQELEDGRGRKRHSRW